MIFYVRTGSLGYSVPVDVSFAGPNGRCRVGGLLEVTLNVLQLYLILHTESVVLVNLLKVLVNLLNFKGTSVASLA
jgi:hypothetical protein